MNDKAIPQRTDYVAGRVSHHDYYTSVASTAGIKPSTASKVYAACFHAYVIEGDEHLNNVAGMNLTSWDNLASAQQIQVRRALLKHGDFWSQAGGVCVAKTAMINAIMLDGKGPLYPKDKP